MTSPPAPLAVKPEFIVDLALGIYPPDKLCAKHGVSDLELMQLYTQEWFNRAIAEKKAELEKAGFNFTAKMKMMAEDLLVDVYHAAKLSDAITPKLDVVKHLTKIAGLEPAPNAQQMPIGGAFQVVINFNGGRETVTLENIPNAKEHANQSDRIDLRPVDSGWEVAPLDAREARTLDLPVRVQDVNRDLGIELEAGQD